METYINCSSCQSSPSSYICQWSSSFSFLCESCLKEHLTESLPDHVYTSFISLLSSSNQNSSRMCQNSYPSILEILHQLNLYRNQIVSFQQDLTFLPNKVISYLNSHISTVLELCLSIQDRITSSIAELTQESGNRISMIDRFNAEGLSGILEGYYYPYMEVCQDLIHKVNCLVYIGDTLMKNRGTEESNQIEKLYLIIYDINSKLKNSISSTEELIETEIFNYTQSLQELNKQLKDKIQHESNLLQTIEELKFQLDKKDDSIISMEISDFSESFVRSCVSSTPYLLYSVDKAVNTDPEDIHCFNNLYMKIEDLESCAIENYSKLNQMEKTQERYKHMAEKLKTELEHSNLMYSELKFKYNIRETLTNNKIKSLDETIKSLETKLQQTNLLKETIIKQIAMKETELLHVMSGLKQSFLDLQTENDGLKNKYSEMTIEKESLENKLNSEKEQTMVVINEFNEKQNKLEQDVHNARVKEDCYKDKINQLDQELLRYTERESVTYQENTLINQEMITNTELKQNYDSNIRFLESTLQNLQFQSSSQEVMLKDQISSLNTLIKTTTASNEKLSKEIQTLNQTYTDQLSAYETRLNIYYSQNNAMQKELHLQEKRYKVMVFKKDTQFSKITKRSQKLLKDNQVFYSRIKRYEDMERYLDELKARNDSLYQNYTQLTGKHDLLIEETKDSMDDLQAQYEYLKASYSQLSEYHGSFIDESKHSIDELQTKYDHLQQSYALLVERNKELLDDLDKSEAETEAASDRYKEALEEVNKIKKDRETVLMRNSELERGLEENRRLVLDTERMQEEISSQIGVIRNNTEEKAALELKNQELNTLVKKSESNIEELNMRYQAILNERAILSVKLQELELQISHRNKQNLLQSEDILSYQAQIENITLKNTALLKQNQTYKSDLTSSTQLIASLQLKLSTKSQEIESQSSLSHDYLSQITFYKQQISEQASKLQLLTQADFHLSEQLNKLQSQLKTHSKHRSDLLDEKSQTSALLISKDQQYSDLSSQYINLCTQRDSLIESMQQNEKLRISLETKISSMNLHINSLKDELLSQSKQNQTLEDLILNLKNENKSLKNELSHLNSLESSISKLSKENEGLKPDLAVHLAQDTERNERIKDLDGSVPGMIYKYNCLLNEYTSYKDNHDSERYKLKAKILIKKNQIISYQKALNELHTSTASEIESLKYSSSILNQNYQQEISNLQTSEQKYKEANDSLNNYILALRKHYEDAKSTTLVNYSSVETQKLNLKKAIEDNQTTYVQKEHEFVQEKIELNTEIAVLKKQLKGSMDRMSQRELEYGEDKVQVINQNTVLCRDIENYKNMISSLNDSLKSKSYKAKQYKQKLQISEYEIQRLETVIKEQTSYIYELRIKYATMNDKAKSSGSCSSLISSLQTDNQTLKLQLNDKQSEIYTLHSSESLSHREDDPQPIYTSSLTTRESFSSPSSLATDEEVSSPEPKDRTIKINSHKSSTERFIFLAQPNTKKLVKYDTIARTVTLTNLQFYFSKPFNLTACSFIPYNKLLIIGSCNPLNKEACIIHLQTGEKHKLADLNIPRGSISICYYNNYIYAFGGRDKCSLGVVERFDTKNNSWMPLRNMIHERESASCILINDKIMIIGGGHQSIEEYDTNSRQFKLLNLFISSPYVIAVRNDEFIYTIEERRCVTYDTNMQVIEDCTNIWNNTLVPYGNVVFRCDVIFYNAASSTIDSVDLKNKQWRNLINLNL